MGGGGVERIDGAALRRNGQEKTRIRRRTGGREIVSERTQHAADAKRTMLVLGIDALFSTGRARTTRSVVSEQSASRGGE